MKKILFILVWGIVLTSACIAQKKKEVNTPVTVSYCLPKVSYKVKVKAEVVRHIPGPYAEYAEKELGMKPPVGTQCLSCS